MQPAIIQQTPPPEPPQCSHDEVRPNGYGGHSCTACGAQVMIYALPFGMYEVDTTASRVIYRRTPPRRMK